MNKMKSIELNEEQQLELAKNLLDIRIEGTNNTYSQDQIAEVNVPQRDEDMTDDLWTRFNVIQENIIEGNFLYDTIGGKSRQARVIKNFKQDMRN